MSEKSVLIGRLSADRNLREAYIRSKVTTNVASQIRALRRRGQLTQVRLAQLADMKQSRISAIEYPGNRLNIDTLVRLAAALKVGLTVRFESFSGMVHWENEFSQDQFSVVTLDRDIEFAQEAEPEPEIPMRAMYGIGNDAPVWAGVSGEAIHAY